MNVFALLGAVVVLGVAAALRAAGASVVRTPRADALHAGAEGDRGAVAVARLLQRPERIQPAVSAVHSALLVLAALPAAWAITVSAVGWQLAVDLGALGLAMVVLGDLLPRAVGRRYPGRLAYRLSPLLAPAVRIGGTATDLIFEEEGEVSAEDAEDADDADDKEEIELISSVLEFSDTIVREVMVPRTDMVTLSRTADPKFMLDLIVRHGFTRLPVTGEDVDDVVGMVIAKDLLTYLQRGQAPRSVDEVLRPVDFVPETKPVADLLRDMQRSKTHMAVVVDEFGGTAGLVTIEDLLEELVGEIVDEYDQHDEMVKAEGDDAWLVDARLSVAGLSEAVGVELPDEGWDTVGGLVLGLAGRLPQESESFRLGALTFTPVRLQGRRVAQVRVEKSAPAKVATEDRR